LAVQGEVVRDLRKGALLDEAGGWISCQQRSPTGDGQFGFETLQMENTVEVVQVMISVVKRLKPLTVTFLAVRPKQFDS
jgi:hypothetical protein